MPLSGRIILVTGASRGIGAATALALAQQGAHVVLTARTQGGLEAVEQQIHDSGGTATLAPVDLLVPDQIDALAAAIAARWGRLDALVLNAAQLGEITPVAHIETDMLTRVLAINTIAPARLLKACDGLLRAAPAARIIGLTTSVARAPRAYWGAYAASKAAFENLLLTYADEVENISPVRVALYNPGRTATRMRQQAYPGEDPRSLPDPALRAAEIRDLLINDFSTRSFHSGQMPSLNP